MVPIEHVAIPATVRVTRSLFPTSASPAASRSRCSSGPSHGENLREGALWQGLARGGTTWVDWVHALPDGDLVFACDGRVYRLSGWRDLPPDRYLDEARLLADFTDLRFCMMAAPMEALRW